MIAASRLDATLCHASVVSAATRSPSPAVYRPYRNSPVLQRNRPYRYTTVFKHCLLSSPTISNLFQLDCSLGSDVVVVYPPCTWTATRSWAWNCALNNSFFHTSTFSHKMAEVCQHFFYFYWFSSIRPFNTRCLRDPFVCLLGCPWYLKYMSNALHFECKLGK